jgi:hypothetical protein
MPGCDGVAAGGFGAWDEGVQAGIPSCTGRRGLWVGSEGVCCIIGDFRGWLGLRGTDVRPFIRSTSL